MLKEAKKNITQQDINQYAKLSNDFNPIHVDAKFAATTPMKKPIALGTMSIGLIWQSLYNTYGAKAFEGIEIDIRFLKPVYAGDTITAGGAVDKETNQLKIWVKNAADEQVITGTAHLTKFNRVDAY